MKATMKSEKKHFPVLLNELKSIISPLYGGTFIDCTFGQGGYSKEILKSKKNKVVALDRDKNVYKFAKAFEKKYGDRFCFNNTKFSKINKVKYNFNDVRGIIFDLGLSTLQLNDKKKGISFKSNSKLNMQMGQNTFSAHDVINRMNFEDINKIIKFFGEEKKSKIISKLILSHRKKKNLDTKDLVSIIHKANPKKKKINPATKTFQGIRIFVNKEISELIYGLTNSFNVLPVGGLLAVITFHSIEDKIVKYFFKHYSENSNTSRYYPEKKERKLFKLFNKKPIYPSIEEIRINPSSRSAKLRYGIKISETDNFKSFFDKFKFYLNIENLDKNL